MEHICARCARLGLRARPTLPSISSLANAKSFSTSHISSAEGDSSASKRPSGPPQNRPAGPAPRFQIRKTPVEDSRQQNPGSTQSRQSNASGPRIAPLPPRRTNLPGAQSGAAGGTGQRPPPGQLLLRRSGPPRSTGPSSTQRTPQRMGRGGPPPNRTDKRVRRSNQRAANKAADEEEDENELEDTAAQIDRQIATVIDPSPNPTEEITHIPGKDLSVETLRADWPNTPLSSTGLTETVQQRIEWLAHRIPHGYDTPGQLADRYVKGYLTRFESEEEKTEVIRLAEEMAQKRADEITERKNVDIQPRDMSFDDIASRSEERQGLADTYVKGKYPEVRKQKLPFLNHIAGNLNNNSTYHSADTKQFMETIQRLMSDVQGGRAQKDA
ncbi:hypothetical protein LTR10_021329 [Elasticomyces elasticus]|uniref:Uncharacterized protein n=1 Tax=Exophiala sideris TaxID=1016849 RepID=A0ABR0JEP9_9EURO|nr:hypothetical protein LTR10_021329 [Elasticomyces elasticus]KAK5027545.1 hypothetical protein LTR13_009477 [Exophiala sideris]KAK5032892.1 hypothetical protein LTS07_004303 [Exophiala sideris]KAK5062416.1 hypothetical protein LTR69_004775 [Exophiala sideris]KAK5177574.1 hypothetical protein LTR44_009985 [Eurotiomycetes sp. CCFEE 6388]